MAYFSNGTNSEVFMEQCLRCRFGNDSCPIHYVQATYNYDAVGNHTATSILDALVSNNGDCAMWKMDVDCFGTNGESQPGLNNMFSDPEKCDQTTKMMGREELIEALNKADKVILGLEQDFKDLMDIKTGYKDLLLVSDALLETLYENGGITLPNKEVVEKWLHKENK